MPPPTIEVVFTFAATSHAIGGEQALLNEGIAVRVMPRPSVLGDGCGICLRTAQSGMDSALRVLAQAGVDVEGVYLKSRECGKSVYTKVPRKVPRNS